MPELKLAVELTATVKHPRDTICAKTIVFTVRPVLADVHAEVFDRYFDRDHALADRLTGVTFTAWVERGSDGQVYCTPYLEADSTERISVIEAERVVRKLRPLQRKLDTYNATDGPAQSAGQHILRFMRAVGAKLFVRESPRDPGWYQVADNDGCMVCGIFDSLVADYFAPAEAAA